MQTGTSALRGFYLGEEVEVVQPLGDNWVEAFFPADFKSGKAPKIWKMWAPQIENAPWSGVPLVSQPGVSVL